MAQTTKRPRDPNQLARAIVEIATGEAPEGADAPKVARAKKAGQKGGPARARALTPEQRADIARVAAAARWKKSD